MADLKKLQRDINRKKKSIDSRLKRLDREIARISIKRDGPIKSKVKSLAEKIPRRGLIPQLSPKPKIVNKAEKLVPRPFPGIIPVKQKPFVKPRPIVKPEIPVLESKVQSKPVWKPAFPKIHMPKIQIAAPKFTSIHIQRKFIAGIFLVVLVVLFFATLTVLFSKPLTKDEFVSRVQSCKSGAYLGAVDGSLVRYETKNCEVSKQIASIAYDEPEEIKVLFQDKKMVCKYRKGEFNIYNIDYMMADIDSCWGELKDILLELKGYSLGKLVSA